MITRRDLRGIARIESFMHKEKTHTWALVFQRSCDGPVSDIGRIRIESPEGRHPLPVVDENLHVDDTGEVGTPSCDGPRAAAAPRSSGRPARRENPR
ncbi:MAG: hypothetical protein JF597_42380 [Streptomyces sp.]|uniref:hypothetical protein n=1 Tax=Streptomyces sp. TaxID=1931 RepID=UPI0025F55C46|nr:hypothetical protein [Streptomyces sp.]MBW8799997.1 hypothetical protein [Streptomyces sp.]